MLTELSFANLVEELEKDLILTDFFQKCLNARIINARVCAKHRIYYEWTMTEKEQLFADLYSQERKAIAEIDDLTLAARREQLEDICYRAKATLKATLDEQDDRKRKKKGAFAEGFRPIKSDITATDAIGKIKERTKKADRIASGLKKLGVSEEFIKSVMSVKNITEQIRVQDKDKTGIVKKDELSRPFVNPFAKKIIEPEANKE